MEEDRSHMTERILNLTLEIIYLLTGEGLEVVKKSTGKELKLNRRLHGPSSAVLPCDSLKPERPNMEKVLEVTKKMMELLTGEVPIRCQDVSVYFSMEEWEYLGGHRDLYKDVVMENEPPLTSPDRSSKRNPPERCPRPLYSQDPTQEDHTVPHQDQSGILGDYIIIVNEEFKEEDEEYGVMKELFEGQKTLYKDIMTEPPTMRNPPERCPRPLYSRDSTQEDLTIPHHDQVEDMKDVKLEVKEEETSMMGDHQSAVEAGTMGTVKVEGSSIDISSGGHHISSADDDGEDNGITRPSQGERPFLCSECGHSFKRKEHLQRHVRSHTGERFPCVECGKRFLRKDKLNRHLQIHTGEKLNACLGCGKRFTRKEGLVTHLRTHTCEKPYLSTDSSHKGDFNRRWKSHEGEHLFSCSECGECFEMRSELILHQRLHTGEKIFSCSECGKSFINRFQLAVHQRSHTGEKPFPCAECEKSFTTKSELLAHGRRHTGDKPFSCAECEKSFTTQSELVAHRARHTGKKPFSCSECGKSYSRKVDLNNHIKVHTGEKPFCCPECGKSYSRKNELNMHLRTHTGERPFSCSECGKRFTQRGKLHRHQKIHTGERPYSCSECGKSFLQNANLLEHLRRHTGERPFSCSVCGKGFPVKKELVLHQKSHTGECSFSCPECGKCFTGKRNLTVHRRSHKGK